MNNYSEDEYLMISGITHFCYCKRRWALTHIEQVWADNEATMEGHFLHERVDDPFLHETRKDIIISRAMPIASKQLSVSGILDVVEFHREDTGIPLPGREGCWKPHIIEYKRGSGKNEFQNLMQLTAQVICLEEMFCCTISSSSFYYYATKRRKNILITDEMRETLTKIVEEMHQLYKEGKTPKVEDTKRCRGCSMVDVCMPQLTQNTLDVSNYIKTNIKA